MTAAISTSHCDALSASSCAGCAVFETSALIDRRADAEQISRAHRQDHEHGHIEHAVAKRSPGGNEKWPTRVEYGGTPNEEQPQI
ncbi:hypothetical protein LCGC14_1287380 [marine sediment metagenome]|uniref:Uncharacterized protein n=1 Tax=marine sediment metagenome TaxID=412755 RepID=A0A0F9KV61_9ZZZZ|nr:hypothetical protein [Marinobacter antarcticus]